MVCGWNNLTSWSLLYFDCCLAGLWSQVILDAMGQGELKSMHSIFGSIKDCLLEQTQICPVPSTPVSLLTWYLRYWSIEIWHMVEGCVDFHWQTTYHNKYWFKLTWKGFGCHFALLRKCEQISFQMFPNDDRFLLPVNKRIWDSTWDDSPKRGRE